MTITFRQNSANFLPNWHQLFGEFSVNFRSFYTDLLSFFRVAACQMFFHGARAYAIATIKPWTLAVGEHIVTRTAAAPTHGNQTHVTMRAAATVTGVNATSNARLKQHKKYIFPHGKTSETAIIFRQNSAKFSPNWYHFFW